MMEHAKGCMGGKSFIMRKSPPVRIPVEVRPAFMPRFNGSLIFDQQAKIVHPALGGA